jgi:predicted nucleotidyltransferase
MIAEQTPISTETLINFGILLFHMEQKAYNIAPLLLRDRTHVRSIARELHTNNTTVSRTMKALEADNVVSFRAEGKNKTYELKKSIEARAFVLAAEQEQLPKAIKKYPQLRNIVEFVQGEKQIALAILFGSYAKGTPTQESDIDLFIETKKLSLKRELELLNTKLSVTIGTFSPQSALGREIIKHHVILKGVELFYEKNQVFG